MNKIKSIIAALAVGGAMSVAAMAPAHAADSGYNSQYMNHTQVDANSPSRTPSIYKGA